MAQELPKIIFNNTPEEIKKLLSSKDSPVCFVDSRLDYDALCSATAFKQVLKTYFGKDLTLNFENEIPDSWLNRLGDFFMIGDINMNININSYDFSKHDLLVFLDTGSIAHISSTDRFAPPKNIDILNVDHHELNPGYGTYNFVKPYGSACTVLYELLDTWGVNITKTLANTLITGMTTDSGFFQYSSTTPEDLKYSAELINKGADYLKIVHKLTFNDTPEDYKLNKIVFNNLVYLPKYKTAYSSITLKELEIYGLELKNTFVAPADLIKKLTGTDFVFVIKESDTENNFYNVSFRSHTEDYDVGKLAKSMGPGGGHKMAASVNINAANVDEVVKRVLDCAEKIKSQENS